MLHLLLVILDLQQNSKSLVLFLEFLVHHLHLLLQLNPKINLEMEYLQHYHHLHFYDTMFVHRMLQHLQLHMMLQDCILHCNTMLRLHLQVLSHQ